ncbi:MAG: alpha/beta hydrolase [Saprospirales bacterium]|nr:alpha/beta hydrolase [Saprospirales bacterium]
MTCQIIHQTETHPTQRVGSKPTLVIDAGMGNWSLFFHPLAEELKKFSKVCLINRSGYVRPHSGATATDGFSIARQMKKVLEQQGISEQIILVGHSLGGLHVRCFQHLFPGQVAGMVLLDAAHPSLLEVMPQVKANLKQQIRMVRVITVLAWAGLLRFAKSSIPTFGLQPALHDSYYKVTTRARYYRTYGSEMQNFESNLALGKTLGSLGDLPLLIISSPYGLNKPLAENSSTEMKEDTLWMSLQEDFARLSSRSRFVKSTGDHFLHLTDTGFVAGAIREFYCDIQD